jgi:sugar phosphate isomerase/epimerase
MTVQGEWTRRQWLAATTATVGGGMATNQTHDLKAEGAKPTEEPFGYCLNTSSIQGQKRDLVEVVEIAAKAGYQALEPWIFELDQFVKQGGSLKELGQRIRDRGLTVESAIGFSEWVVDAAERRSKGLEDMRRSMSMVQQLGGKRIAAPPAGATASPGVDPFKVAERYRAVLELSDQMGVVPQVEIWGPSHTLRRLSEAALAAVESGHPKACILADVYHLYKGGSDPRGLGLLNGRALQVIHFNDYPAQPRREAITDAQRVYPGDGVAPLRDILRTLKQMGFRGFLSLELFNRTYWKQDALLVARTGLEKLRAVVRRSLA